MGDTYQCSQCGKKIGSGFGQQAPRKCVKCGYMYCPNCIDTSVFSGAGKCPRCGGEAKKMDHV